MSNVLDAVLAQYEKSKQATSGNKISQEEREKKYFTTILPKGVKREERRIRILPPSDLTQSPFEPVYFHDIQIDGKNYKLFDPKQEGKRSPLNEVYEALMESGTEADRKLAMDYRAKKFYIVKVIDRDKEADGPKFWRFKSNSKNDGIFDKIFPVFSSKGDVTDIKKGRDLILTLSLTKSGNGKEYTVVSSVIPDDPTPLHADPNVVKSWVEDPLKWRDVYSIKDEAYLEMVAKGEVPRWDSVAGKYVSSSNTFSDETLSNPKTVINDAQEDGESSDDLPF